jgi:hypothetical protein
MQRALRAERIGSTAEMLARVDDQGVKFVEELVVAGERGFEGGAEFFVGRFGISEMVAFEDAAGIGVHNKDGLLAGVEQDGVSSFRPDAALSEELFAKGGGRHGEKMIEGATVFFVQEGYKGFESFGFLTEVSGGAEMAGELGQGDIADRGGGQQLGASQVGDGAFGVFPGSVLRKDCAYDNFEAGAAGPPVLRAIGGEERRIVGMQVVFRPGNCGQGGAQMCSLATHWSKRRGDNLRQR